MNTTQEKEIDNPDKPMTWSRCFARPGDHCIIDIIHPLTKLTLHYGKTLAECPGAVEMTVDDFCKAKAEQQDAPVTWDPISEEQYWDRLECLPPACMISGSFLVGEPYDHHALTGAPRYQAVLKRGEKYLASSRPMARTEFKALFASESASVAAEQERSASV